MNLDSVLVELEGGHARDSTSRRGLLVLINVNLDKDSLVLFVFCKLGELRSNHLAWSAPGSSKVNYNELVSSILEASVELSLGFKHPDSSAAIRLISVLLLRLFFIVFILLI